MLSRTRTLRFMSILGVLLSVALMACSGGGGGGGSSKAPQLTVVPPGPYNFGVVTEGNTAQPLQVVIRNDGTMRELEQNVDEVWQELLSRERGKRVQGSGSRV